MKNIKLRMEIGDQDYFMLERNRKGTKVMHQYFQDLNIPHEYKILKGRGHGISQFWFYKDPNSNDYHGLDHLKFHEKVWKQP